MAIPGTSLLSLFAGPAENPLYEGGKWSGIEQANPLKKEAGTPTGSATDSVHGSPNYSYWTPATYYASATSGIVEVWGCPVGGGLGAALETWRLALWRDNPDNVQGYLLYNGGGIGKAFTLRRYNGGSLSNFVDIASVGATSTAQMMLRINGPYVEGWRTDDGVNWYKALSVLDTTYRGSFYLVLGIEDPTAGGLGWNCFGGGIKLRTQIYRVLPTLK